MMVPVPPTSVWHHPQANGWNSKGAGKNEKEKQDEVQSIWNESVTH